MRVGVVHILTETLNNGLDPIIIVYKVHVGDNNHSGSSTYIREDHNGRLTEISSQEFKVLLEKSTI